MATAKEPAENLATEADEVLVEVDMMVADDLWEVGRTAEVIATTTGPLPELDSACSIPEPACP